MAPKILNALEANGIHLNLLLACVVDFDVDVDVDVDLVLIRPGRPAGRPSEPTLAR